MCIIIIYKLDNTVTFVNIKYMHYIFLSEKSKTILVVEYSFNNMIQVSYIPIRSHYLCVYTLLACGYQCINDIFFSTLVYDLYISINLYL